MRVTNGGFGGTRRSYKKEMLEFCIVSSDFSSKKTPLSLPHCHPIPIEGCNVEWQEVENGLKCVVTVSTTSKTGVEMEALCGVSTALLCAWDMLKPILKDSSGQYPDTKISDITVISKLKIPTEN